MEIEYGTKIALIKTVICQFQSFLHFVKLPYYYESKHTNHISANYVFSAFFQHIRSYGGASEKKKDFGFDTEIVILELVEGVMNVFQNNEVIDVCKVAKPTKHTCYNLS